MSDNNIQTYDVIVIGAGPVGENVADRTSAAGLSTVIVESELVGGECSYWACEPSKALLRPALLHSSRAMRTTSAPRARQAVAISTATTPAPRMASRRGTSHRRHRLGDSRCDLGGMAHD
jgi:pyruvate/2-oxoglutarate dehydrogenase complex dihydrolipoamide dehydrogenase (E3) component